MRLGGKIGMKAFIAAVQFLTIVPLVRDLRATNETLGNSIAYFPLVGFLIGMLLALCNGVMELFLPIQVGCILIIALLIILTGAIHLDGFVDALDGLAGGRGRERMLEIMKDSRIGAIGVIGVVVLLLIKYISLINLPRDLLWQSLMLMPVMGRWSMAQLCYSARYARENGTGRPFVNPDSKKGGIFAAILTLTLLTIFLGLKGVVIGILLSLFTHSFKAFFHYKIGGVTGDVIGAANELSEVLFLLLVLIFYPW